MKRGGQLVEASYIAIPSWDPQLFSGAGLSGWVMVYENLLNLDLVDQAQAKWELRPGLAESWDQPDATTIVFKLRKGVKFHDGSDLTGEVVKWNIDRMRSDPKAVLRTQLTAIDAVDAVDTSTVRVKLKAPSPAMLRILSSGSQQAIISKAHFDKVGADGLALNPSGTGPMKLKSFKQDDRAVLEPFKDYWQNGADGKPLPYIDEFVFRYMPDLSTALVELQSGGVHAVRDFSPGISSRSRQTRIS